LGRFLRRLQEQADFGRMSRCFPVPKREVFHLSTSSEHTYVVIDGKATRVDAVTVTQQVTPQVRPADLKYKQGVPVEKVVEVVGGRPKTAI